MSLVVAAKLGGEQDCGAGWLVREDSEQAGEGALIGGPLELLENS